MNRVDVVVALGRGVGPQGPDAEENDSLSGGDWVSYQREVTDAIQDAGGTIDAAIEGVSRTWGHGDDDARERALWISASGVHVDALGDLERELTHVRQSYGQWGAFLLDGHGRVV